MKVLILCTGISCRSQMAQGLLQFFDKGITVCSGATEPATHVNPLAIKVMNEIGIDISHYKPSW
jgi:arsenate reductase